MTLRGNRPGHVRTLSQEVPCWGVASFAVR